MTSRVDAREKRVKFSHRWGNDGQAIKGEKMNQPQMHTDAHRCEEPGSSISLSAAIPPRGGWRARRSVGQTDGAIVAVDQVLLLRAYRGPGGREVGLDAVDARRLEPEPRAYGDTRAKCQAP